MATACGELDSDLLGLGVRLGIYLQVLAFGILVSTGGHSTLLGHGEAASATVVAVLVVMFYKLAHGDIHAAEFACVLMMINIYSLIAFMGVAAHIGSALCDCTGAWRVRTASREQEMMRRGARVILEPRFDPGNRWHLLEAMQLEVVARSARRLQRSVTLQLGCILATWVLGAWFWQTGYKGLQRSGCDPVRTAWIWGSVPAFGWNRVFSLVATYLAVSFFGSLFLGTLVAGMRGEEDKPPSALAHTDVGLDVSVQVEQVAVEERQMLLRGVTQANKASMRKFVVLLVIAMGGVAVFLEMNLFYNGLQTDSINLGGLGNSGQILSLVVGFALVLSSLHAPVEPCNLWMFVTGQLPEWEEQNAAEGNDGAGDAFAAVARSAKAHADMRLQQLQAGPGDQAV